MKRLALALSATAAAVWAAGASAATPVRIQVVLKPNQVGPGYRLLEIPEGNTLRQPTLDLCGAFGYPSEKLREARLQVGYAKRGSLLQLSNEVVTYRADGAAQAVREVRRRALTCPSRSVRFTPVSDPHLVPGYFAVREVDTRVVRGKHLQLTTYAVYQRMRNVLSAVYSVGPPGSAQLAFCLHAAEQAAQNLRGWYLGGPPA
jgi:hypothetical protein